MGGAFKRLSRDLAPDPNLSAMQNELASLGGQPKHTRNREKARQFGRRRGPTKIVAVESSKDLGDLVKEQVFKQDRLAAYLTGVGHRTTGNERYALRFPDNTLVESSGRVIGFHRKDVAKEVRDHLKSEFQMETFVTTWIDHATRQGGLKA